MKLWKMRLLAAFAPVLCLPGVASAQTKIVAGIANFNEDMMSIYAALDKGYFKQAGLDVDLQFFKGGAPAAQAMVAGGIDICLCAADHVLRLRARRQPATVLVGLDDFHAYALIVKGDAPFTDLASLKGKRIGVTSPGSLTDNTIRYEIKKLGLNPQRDYEIVAAGTGATMRAALSSGHVDAGMLVTTDAVDALRTPGAYKVVADYRGLPYPSFDALALVSWVNAHRDAARGFHDAVVHAIGDLNKDPAFATAVMREMYPSLPQDAAAATAQSQLARMPKDGSVSAAAVKNLNDIVTAADDSLQPATDTDVYDPALVAH